MKTLAKALFVLAVLFGLLSTEASGRILNQDFDDDDRPSKALPLPNPFGGGFTFPGGAGSTGGWFPGQGGSIGPGSGSAGSWFPGQGGGSNIPGSHHFCSLPGIKCATTAKAEAIPATNNDGNP